MLTIFKNPLRTGFSIKNILIAIVMRYFLFEQGQKRPLDTPKRMIKRRESEGKREKER